MNFSILTGDALTILRTLPAESVQMVVTSPPYWGLRDYGTATWDGGDAGCDHLAPPRGGRNPETAGKQLTNAGTLIYQFDRACGKCGARRIDSQLGLERTPEEYVGKLVEVFREVRRVLRKDGTLWLNLGDSYAGNGGGASAWSTPLEQTKKRVANANLLARDMSGLKPKDLVGIPWRVAFALQQPYYTGKIRDERDRIWLAAMVEAEGCMFIHRRPEGMSNGQGYERKNDSFGAGLEVSSTDRVIVERCLEITGLGSICEQSPDQNKRRKQTIYRWNLRSNVCRDVVRELYPHMIAKQHEARLLLGCPSSGPKATEAWASLKALHQGGTATIDFPAPESLFEPGWYLRAEIIWAKKNCMPESVTDRPTKSHEQVFLLTKSPRYYFDQEAVREAHIRLWDETNGGGFATEWHDSAKLGGHGRAERPYPLPNPAGRNIRSVWNIATQPFPEAHFATFPEALAERCIKAGTSEKGCCATCGTPWDRVVERTAMVIDRSDRTHPFGQTRSSGTMLEPPTSTTTGWSPSCACGAGYGVWEPLEVPPPEPVPCTVLDPFCGSGTAGVVALALQRNFLGIELNPKYVEMAERRIGSVAPLFLQEAK